MRIPLEITFRNMSTSPSLTAAIEDWVRKLEQVASIQRCAIVVERAHDHGRAAPFAIHLAITIPGHEFAVSHGGRHGRKNAYLAVAEAFRAARRQLVDFVAQRREARPAALSV